MMKVCLMWDFIWLMFWLWMFECLMLFGFFVFVIMF